MVTSTAIYIRFDRGYNLPAFSRIGGSRESVSAPSAHTFDVVAAACEAEGLTLANAERLGREIARAFGVKEDEVGILRLEKRNLAFCYPDKLKSVGSIPLNTSNSIAVRTVNSRRAEIINNFAQIKHTSIFEAVELATDNSGLRAERHSRVIQKMMSVPVLGVEGAVGVVQVCRKGISGPEAGPDFSQSDLQKLVTVAASLAKCFK